jgi:NitT/TauT family transport system ATP-binding protein
MDTPPAIIQLHAASKRFGNGVQALAECSLQLASGEFVSLLGPSGCGKSTVLRLVAGLEQPSSGTVQSPALQGAEAATAYVFQEPALMPWASVFDNVWLPLRLAGHSRAASRDRIETALHGVGLQDFGAAFPAELSGGMKMRTSIARALITQPRVLLMDEPFAALDEITRSRLNSDLLALWTAQRLSVLFVTHSVYESVFLSQRVLVLGQRPGRVVAEVHIDAPYPRNAAFRRSAPYLHACAELSAALEAAYGDTP